MRYDKLKNQLPAHLWNIDLQNIYAIATTNVKEHGSNEDPITLRIVLHNLDPDKDVYAGPSTEDLETKISYYDKTRKSMFDAVMTSIAKGRKTFDLVSPDRTKQRYTFKSIDYVDPAFVARYQEPKEIKFRKTPTITFYYKSNGCFMKKHHCTACKAYVKDKEDLENPPYLIDIIRCDECEKYFVTKEMFDAVGGCWCYDLKPVYDPSILKSEEWKIEFGYYRREMDGLFDEFEEHSSINKAGYTTTKSTFERQRLLRKFVETGMFTKEEIIQYLHEKYLDTGWHGEVATAKAREDLKYVLTLSEPDEIVSGTLVRP